MEKKCEFFEHCPIVRYFGQTGWTLTASRYCRGGQKDQCARRKLHLADEPVPKHLMPWDKSSE
jgi:hypothetical protein